MFCSRWSDTAEHGPEFILRGVPDGIPAYLASRPFYHTNADPGKAFAEMENEIWKAAKTWHFSSSDDERREWEEKFDSLRELETRNRSRFLAYWYADLQEELRVLTYNPITINDPTHRRKRRRGAQEGTTTAEHADEAECEEGLQEGVQEVRVPVENEDTTRREFDARPGKLAVMENRTDTPDPYLEESLLGDWENK
eukprot:jgi/Tetstr1/465364/TSEL_010050.t1